MKRTIFPQDFSQYYPIGIQPCRMYVDVANRIYDKIRDVDINLPDANKLKKEIAINAAIYFEDKMSDIGLWNAFVNKHMLTYQRPLPFFDDFKVLDKNEVNVKEVELLIWLVLSRNFSNRFLNPLAMGEYTANIIMEVLNEDDDVDINDSLYDYIYNTDKANDYFKLKPVLIWLRQSYLLYSPLSEERFEECLFRYSTITKKSDAVYYAETFFSMDSEIGPMAVLPHLWLADMYFGHNMQKEAKNLTNLEYCLPDMFEVIEADATYTVLKNSKDEEYRLKNEYSDIFRKGAYLYSALVKYANNDWEINGGVLSSTKENYDKMRMRQAELKKSYELAYPLYMKRTGGKRLAFLENIQQLQEWLKKISPEMDMTEVCDHLPSGPQVAFISKKAGIILAPNIIHAIKCSDNPYYRKCDAQTLQQESIVAIINTEAVHPELLHYLLDNDMLQDADLSKNFPSELDKNIFKRNIDFIARQYRRHLYHDHDF